jgi:DNA-binding transcriptional LysR family regulator
VNLFVLDYFIAIAEYHNFTKAAEALYVTQPTLSRQIDLLEKEMGVKLFIRNNHSVNLTPAGVIFLEEAREVIKRYQKMKLRMESVKRGISNTLQIGYTGTICYDVLARALRSIYKDYPKIEVSIIQNDSLELFGNVFNENLDAIFTLKMELKEAQGLSWEKVADGELRCLVNDEHSLAARNNLSIKDLKKERIILPPRVNCPIFYDHLLDLFNREGIQPDILTIPETQNIRFMVKAGFGITLASNCENTLETGIKSLAVEESDQQYDVVISWKNERKNPALKIFLDEIKKQEENTDS